MIMTVHAIFREGWRKLKKEILAFVFFLGLGVYATFPLIFNFRTSFYGLPYDSLVWLWHLWWLRFSWQSGISSDFVPILAFPFGLNTPPLSLLWQFFNKWTTVICGEVVTYNLQIVLSFVLTGLAMYYLVYRFTKHRMAAFFAGAAFTLCPYHFARSWDHLDLSTMQWMVLYILALFVMREKRTYASAVLCGICFGLIGHLSNFYYVYFMALFSVLFLIWHIVCGRLTRKTVPDKPGRKTIALIGVVFIVALMMIIPQISGQLMSLVSSKTASAGAGIARPFNQLFADSATPFNYFLPAEYHPVLGNLTRPFIGTIFYGDNAGGEQSLFVGFGVFILAVAGVGRWIKRRKNGVIHPGEDFIIPFFAVSFWVFFLTSFRPYWGDPQGFFIPFPSYFLYKIFPMFRNYARLGSVVMLSLCVLAGFGVRDIMQSMGPARKRMFFICGIFALTLFEFLNIPPYRITYLTDVPPVYTWLQQQPDSAVIAEYPLEADNRWYLFYQRVHKKSMINYVVPGTEAAAVQAKISDIASASTPGILKFLGVDYVIMHQDKYRRYEGGGVLGEVPEISGFSEYQLVKDFGSVKVYRLQTVAIDPKTVSVRERPEVMSEVSKLPFVEKNNAIFEDAKVFRYKVKCFGVIPIMTSEISVGKPQVVAGERVIPITGRLQMIGVLSKLLDVSGQVESFMDAEGNGSYRYYEMVQVNRKKKERTINFDQLALRMYQKNKVSSIHAGTHDPLSLLVYLSTLHFKPGESVTLHFVMGSTNYRLSGTVLGKAFKKINNARKEVWQFQVTLFELHKSKQAVAQGMMWLDADNSSLPLMIEVPTRVGSLKIQAFD